MDDIRLEAWAARRCSACRPGTKPLDPVSASRMAAALDGWTLADDARKLRVEYVLENFTEAARLIAEIARVADAEDHHPDLHLTGYRRLVVELSTHAAGGLTENDFILAAKIARIPKSLRGSARADA